MKKKKSGPGLGEGFESLLQRTLIDTIPDLVWLKSREGVYLTCNHRFEKFFGAKESDIIGKTDYDFFTKDREIKKINQGAIIIVQTAYPEDEINAKEAGCSGFTSKPYSKNGLLDIVGKYYH